MATLTSLFVAVSTNTWIAGLQPLVLAAMRCPGQLDPQLFFAAAMDFYNNQVW